MGQPVVHQATLAEWRSTARLCRALDVWETLGLSDWQFDDRLVVYQGNVYISQDEKIGYWLQLHNSQYTGELADLEEILYGYVVSEGLLE